MAAKNYVDPLLTNIAKGYRPFGHANMAILPSWPVKKNSGKIGSYSADNLRLVTSIKAPDGGTPVVEMSTAISDAWVLEEHALKALLTDKEVENEDLPFKGSRDKTELVMDLHSVYREYALANFMGTVGNFTNSVTLAGTDQWGGSTDDPEDDLETAIQTVKFAIGVPRALLSIVMSDEVFGKFIQLQEIKDRMYGDFGLKVLTNNQKLRDMVAQSFGVKQVITPDGFYNSAALGQADNLAAIWGKHAWVVNIPDGSMGGIKIQPFGYTFEKKAGTVVDSWRDYDKKGDWIRGTVEYDQFICNELAAYMIEDAIP